MKAFRTVDGRVVTFRPDQNAARFAEGAGRMSMPPVPADIFVNAVKKCISAGTRPCIALTRCLVSAQLQRHAA